MNLLTVGDSFTYGDELADQTTAWPYVLGNKIGYTVTNLGEPATGNTSMVRKVLHNYQSADLIVIAWSHYARLEFADKHGIYNVWPGQQLRHAGVIPGRQELVGYITQYHNDYYMYNQYLNNIVLLQAFLTTNNKRYVMLDAFGNNNTNCRILGNRQITTLVDPTHYLGWPNESMMEWTCGLPQGPHHHFLEEGHQRVADKIYEHIRNLSWVS